MDPPWSEKHATALKTTSLTCLQSENQNQASWHVQNRWIIFFADGGVRLIQHEWMWSSSCEFRETNGCDPLRLGGGEIGWEQSGEGRNFANHGQNSHPLLLETTKSPWRKVIRQLHSSNSVASKQVVFQPAVGEPCLTYLHHMKIRPNMLTVLFCKRRVAQVC